MKNVGQLSEGEIISLFKSAGQKSPLVTGIGDDCAVLQSNGDEVLLWTTDLLTEGVHFTSDSIDPSDLGYKCMTVNLSDIAAMGGEPIAALLSIALPSSTPVRWIESFSEGFREAGESFSCQIVGGDTTSSHESITINVSVLGRTEPNTVLLRSTAVSGEDIWISGIPGLSATGFELIKQKIEPAKGSQRAAIKRHVRPYPRIELGRLLSNQSLATAAIDTSDGISQDLHRICEASGVGAELQEELLPLLPKVDALNINPLELAIHGGEDYQLLFTANPNHRKQIKAIGDVTRIGHTNSDAKVVKLKRIDGSVEAVMPGGFTHFHGEHQESS